MTTGPQTACEFLCQQGLECLGGGNCVEVCEKNFPFDCAAQYEAFIFCAAPLLTDECELQEGQCSAEVEAYIACEDGNQDCTTDGCFVGMGECGCEGQCFGNFVETNCQFNGPGGGVQCECFVQGSFVGSCGQGELECDLELSCCSDFF